VSDKLQEALNKVRLKSHLLSSLLEEGGGAGGGRSKGKDKTS
jgi:hypothetical protein